MTAPPNPDPTRNRRDDPKALWSAWRSFAANVRIDSRIQSLYLDLDARVRARGPTCWTSGKCCNFDEYGHRLYVTGLEIAWVLERVEAASPGSGGAVEMAQPAAAQSPPQSRSLSLLPSRSAQPSKGPCRFQAGKLCGAHAIRPMGCRVFFCQEGTSDWQHELYEEFLNRLRVIHDEYGIEYRYMEWRAGLDEAVTLRTTTS